MAKAIALLNTIAWAGFWAFGFLALSASPGESGQMMIAGLLAALGAGMGLLAWFWLARHSERTGYAKPRNRAHVMDRPDDALSEELS